MRPGRVRPPGWARPARSSARSPSNGPPTAPPSPPPFRRLSSPRPTAPTPAPAGLRLTLWTDGTAASHSSTRAHAAAAAILSPTGWQVEPDGGLQGTPDAVTLAAAVAAGRPVWPGPAYAD